MRSIHKIDRPIDDAVLLQLVLDCDRQYIWHNGLRINARSVSISYMPALDSKGLYHVVQIDDYFMEDFEYDHTEAMLVVDNVNKFAFGI
jgi:hypothetical protein